MNEIKSKFPTEIIDLPSEGYFYPPENPLSSGKIELKYMTAKDEDILTNRSFIKKGIVIDKFIESIIGTLFDFLINDSHRSSVLISNEISFNQS